MGHLEELLLAFTLPECTLEPSCTPPFIFLYLRVRDLMTFGF
jgi:hypothetical protein